jgi:hypothetical protein
VRLLADEAQYGVSLIPAAQQWQQQLGKYRTLMVRLAPAKSLHEQLILVDSTTVWVLPYSFNYLAKRTHTGLVRARPEAAARKVAVYAEIWNEATPIRLASQLERDPPSEVNCSDALVGRGDPEAGY